MGKFDKKFEKVLEETNLGFLKVTSNRGAASDIYIDVKTGSQAESIQIYNKLAKPNGWPKLKRKDFRELTSFSATSLGLIWDNSDIYIHIG
jgi:hypothetical protein